MLKHTTNHYTQSLLILALAISLAACSSGTESANTSGDSANSTATSVNTSSSPQPTNSTANIALLGVNSVDEINFKPAPKAAPGFFDGINGLSAPTIQVSKANPITATGWAIISDESRPADRVIITYGENNSIVAVAPVKLERPDVVKVLKNPEYKNSGWATTINASTLPADEVVLRAWAYNSKTKEATPFTSTREVVVVD